jgi:riboflavin synthase
VEVSLFSGIVEETGTIAAFDGSRLEIRARRALEDLNVSDSIAVAGVCLTVVGRYEGGFAVDVVPETLARTSLGRLKPGSNVNLERSLPFGGRIGGHLVQGHVDGLATITSITAEGNSFRIGFKAPAPIMRFVVEKGFIALDGVSLTIAGRTKTGFSITLIPHTKEITTFGERQVGDVVNVEVDVTAKYVEQLVRAYMDGAKRRVRRRLGSADTRSSVR